MSISSSNTSNNASSYWQQLQSLHQQRRQDFSSLTQSVQQGDIAGAQQALAALQQLNGSNNTDNGNQDFGAVLNNAISAASSTSATGASATATDPFAALNNSQTSGGTGNSVSSLLNTLGQDLQSGNLSQAQQAFQQLQQGLQQANGAQASEGGHRHHHHRHDSGGEQNNGLANLLNGGNNKQSAATDSSAGSNAINQQAQAALSLYQASAGNNDISSLLMSLSV
jgi:hypothetical protein